MSVHPTAIIYPGVFFESEPQVDAYAIVGNKDKSPLEIGKNARIGYHSIIRGNTNIGDNFTLGSMSSIEGNPCRIGDDVTIRGKIEIPSAMIGDRVQIYIWTTFYDTPHPPDGPLMPPEIQDDVVLCADVRILGGVVIGKRSWVSAGAFVRDNVPPDSYVTRDGRIKKKLSTDKIEGHLRVPLGDYMQGVWERAGSPRCIHCREAITYDGDSGYWIHAGFEKIDGHNGLYCTAEMWDNPSIRVYSVPT